MSCRHALPLSVPLHICCNTRYAVKGSASVTNAIYQVKGEGCLSSNVYLSFRNLCQSFAFAILTSSRSILLRLLFSDTPEPHHGMSRNAAAHFNCTERESSALSSAAGTPLFPSLESRLTAESHSDADVAEAAKICTSYSTSKALQILESMRWSSTALEAALVAFVGKGSVKGVAGVERLAAFDGLLLGAASKQLFFSLIRSYGSLGRLKDVQRCFEAAQQRGAWSSSDVRLTNVFLHALHKDIRIQFELAKKLIVQRQVKANIATFNTLLKGCMRNPSNNRSYIGQTLQWIKEHQMVPDDITYSSLIKAFSYGGNFEGVLSARELMLRRRFPITPTIWSDLLVACGAAQQPETALMIWREAKSALGGDSKTPSQVYDAMITACNATYQGERALEVFQEMREANVTPSIRTFNLAIGACRGVPGQRVRKEQLDTALSLYNDIWEAGIKPDMFTFGTLMELCASARDGALALSLYNDMEKHRIRANVVIMTSALKALARSKMVNECQAIFRKMVWGPARLKPNACTYRTLAREYREAGELAAALQAYEGMRRAGYAPINREFQELIAAAADATMTNLGDSELQRAVASLFNMTSTEYIDLHGMSSQEARAAVLCILGMLMTEYHRTGCPPRPLTIVTGRGQHARQTGLTDGDSSSNGAVHAAVLPRVIRSLLTEELRILVREDVCLLNEQTERRADALEASPGNPGRIVVPAETLLRWLRARGASGTNQLLKNQTQV